MWHVTDSGADPYDSWGLSILDVGQGAVLGHKFDRQYSDELLSHASFTVGRIEGPPISFGDLFVPFSNDEIQRIKNAAVTMLSKIS